jgi:hypothetical protein
MALIPCPLMLYSKRASQTAGGDYTGVIDRQAEQKYAERDKAEPNDLQNGFQLIV